MTQAGAGTTAVGLALPQFGDGVDRSALRDFCQSAEELGFASLWVQEHIFYAHPEGASAYSAGEVPSAYGSTRYRTMLASTETMMAAAAWTERIRVGSSILVAGYHRPVDLAKRLATIDVLSDGRLIAGLSVGWSEAEHRQMDVDFTTRGRRCDEFVPALRACWADDPVSFEGDFFSIPPADVDPKPVQNRVPLLSGMTSAAGKERTIKHFDIWNPIGEAQKMRQEIDEMNERRPAGLTPLELYLRLFLELPGHDPQPAGVDGVLHAVDLAREADADGVIIEAGFWSGCTTSAEWASLPAKLAAAVAA
jgi:probable F420-dependent oxidoreductase